MSLHKIILLTVLVHLSTSYYLRITSSSSSIIDYLDGTCSIVKCGTSVCATSPNGGCVNETCICNKGYTSKEEDYPVSCCYKQKNLPLLFVWRFFSLLDLDIYTVVIKLLLL